MEPPQCRSRLRRDRDHVDLAVVSASFESILNECHFRAVQPPGEAAIGPETSHQLALLPGSVSCGHFLSLRRGGSQRSRAPIQMRAPAANGEEMKWWYNSDARRPIVCSNVQMESECKKLYSCYFYISITFHICKCFITIQSITYTTFFKRVSCKKLFYLKIYWLS